MVPIIYLFFVYLLAFLYSILFVGIGSISLKIIWKRKVSSNILSKYIILLGVGISTIIPFFYVIFIFGIFNFYTTMIPIIIINIVNFIYNLKKTNGQTVSKFYIQLKKQIIHYYPYIIILIIFSILQILVQYMKIDNYTSLPSKDPYHWARASLFLKKYGTIPKDYYGVYPLGVTFITTSLMVPFPMGYFVFYIIKFITLTFFSMMLLVLYDIVRKFFQDGIYQYFFLTIAMSFPLIFNELVYRANMLVPTVGASLFSLILFYIWLNREEITLINKTPFDLHANGNEGDDMENTSRWNFYIKKENEDKLMITDIKSYSKYLISNKNYHLLGYLFGIVFLLHPVINLLFLSIYILFNLICTISELKNMRKLSVNVFIKSILFRFIVECFILLLFCILGIIPYLINTLVTYGFKVMVDSLLFYII